MSVKAIGSDGKVTFNIAYYILSELTFSASSLNSGTLACPPKPSNGLLVLSTPTHTLRLATSPSLLKLRQSLDKCAELPPVRQTSPWDLHLPGLVLLASSDHPPIWLGLAMSLDLMAVDLRLPLPSNPLLSLLHLPMIGFGGGLLLLETRILCNLSSITATTCPCTFKAMLGDHPRSALLIIWLVRWTLLVEEEIWEVLGMGCLVRRPFHQTTGSTLIGSCLVSCIPFTLLNVSADY